MRFFKYINIIAAALLPLNLACAQDLMFSHYQTLAPVNNPALRGLDTNTIALFHYRRQPVLAGEKFTTSVFSLSHPIFLEKIKLKKHPDFNLRFSWLNNRQLHSFRINGVLLGLSYNLSLNNDNFISFAMQSGFIQKGFGDDGLIFSSQIDPDKGPDPNSPHNESLESTQKTYGILSSGLQWIKLGAFNRKAFLGASIMNMNRPKTGFLNGISNEFRLSPHFIVTGGWEISLNHQFFIQPNFRYILRKSRNFSQFGTQIAYDIATNSKLNLIDQGSLRFGVLYNSNKAITTTLILDQPKYQINLGFDFSLKNNVDGSSPPNKGFEIGMIAKLNTRKKQKPRYFTSPIVSIDSLHIINDPPRSANPPIKDCYIESEREILYFIDDNNLDDASKADLDDLVWDLMNDDCKGTTIIIKGYAKNQVDNKKSAQKLVENLRDKLIFGYEIEAIKIGICHNDDSLPEFTSKCSDLFIGVDSDKECSDLFVVIKYSSNE